MLVPIVDYFLGGGRRASFLPPLNPFSGCEALDIPTSTHIFNVKPYRKELLQKPRGFEKKGLFRVSRDAKR